MGQIGGEEPVVDVKFFLFHQSPLQQSLVSRLKFATRLIAPIGELSSEDGYFFFRGCRAVIMVITS